MRALIVTDIQNDFLPGGALEVPEGDQIIPLVNQLQEKFPLVVATQDWHPANHGSFASVHPGKKPFDYIDLYGIEQILWPDHCVQETKGAEFADALSMNAIETIFRKALDPNIDSYSTFFDNGHKKSTGLSGYLQEKGVKQVYLAGLAGDVCVAFSALDALGEGFETYLIEDATRPIIKDDFATMKAKITEKGGHIIQSSAIL